MTKPTEPRGMAVIDLTGQTFGVMTVLSRGADKAYKVHKKPAWLCACACGAQKILSATGLTSGRFKSCGASVHGMPNGRGLSKIPQYVCWRNMIRACTLPLNPRFSSNGARGISVCETWQRSYETFLSDMGPMPAGDYYVKRNDNTKNYTPGNCTWGTAFDHSRHKHLNSNNTSGVCGIHWDAANNMWRVMIQSRHIGRFSDIEGAIVARDNAYINLGFHSQHGDE